MTDALAFLLGAMTIAMGVQVVTILEVKRAIVELRAAIERLIMVDTSRKL